MEESVKKKSNFATNILLLLFFTIISGSLIYLTPIFDLDELWIFNFSKNIADGMLPYKDFNMITTPLLPFLISLFFRVFGSILIVQRTLCFILFEAILFMVYRITKKITTKEMAIFMLPILIIIFYNIIHIDYNFLSLFFMLVMLSLELKHSQKKDFFIYDFKHDLLIGIIAGLVILTKQTIGVILLIGVAGYKLLAVKNKEELICEIKICITRILGGIIPIIFFAIYLITTNTLNDFLDLCIYGIGTFGNSYNLYLGIIGIIVFAVLALLLLLKKVEDKKLYILYAYSVCSFFIAIPIVDKVHFMLGITISVIALSYLLHKKLKNKNDSKALNVYSIILIFLLLVSVVAYIYEKRYYTYVEKNIYEYNNLSIKKYLSELIDEVDTFIVDNQNKGYDVYIVDPYAAFFDIPLGIYRKYYDMLLIGNLGINGEERIIQDISEKENAIFLISKDGYNWQTPIKVREYIVNNYNCVGEVSIFYIYK